jgi:VWFA-related protein
MTTRLGTFCFPPYNGRNNERYREKIQKECGQDILTDFRNGFARLSEGVSVRLGVLFFACLFWVAGSQVQAQESQQAPNAPSANVPAAPEPQSGNSPGSLKLPNLLHDVTPGEGTPQGTSSTSNGTQTGGESNTTAPAQEQNAPSNVPPPVVPAQGQGASAASYTLRVRTNFVLVPVTVKDKSGQLVAGLTYHDFQIYENGVQQRLSFFTEDPFPLSVAFVIDQSLPADTMRKVNQALSGLQGAFAPYDEVSVYTYASHVGQATGFTGAQSERLTASLSRVKSPGSYMEVPTNTGPLAEGPIINGQMVDPNTTPMHNGNFIGIIPKDQHVLNDAIFRAATDLSQRSKGRRRLIYVISDGKNQGSKVSQKEVVRYLLTNQIAVYGTLVGDSALPVLGFLDRYHIPWQMNDDILPKYAAATGGVLDAELSTNAIERSFAKISEQVRDQYTLGYNSHISVLDSRFRKIEVRVLRSNVNVIAKQGYYPTATANQ